MNVFDVVGSRLWNVLLLLLIMLIIFVIIFFGLCCLSGNVSCLGVMVCMVGLC